MSALLALVLAAGTPVLAHPVPRGTILSADDFETVERPALAGTLSPAEAAGKEAARDLVAGYALRRTDVLPPRLVRRGDPVTIAWRTGGLVIATGGRALSAGGMGEPVRVVAASTNRTLDGVVEGSGAVLVRGQ